MECAAQFGVVAGRLGQAARQQIRIGMIVGQAVNVMLERMQAGRSEHAGLAHGTAQHLANAPRLVNEVLGAQQYRPHGRAQAFGQAQ